MKRLLVAAAALAAILALPVQYTRAEGGSTQHITTLSATLPIACAGLFTGVTQVNATGNGIVHLNANGAGSWFTTTFTGEGTIAMAPPGTTYQGHVQFWAGVEDNNQNGVQHATFDFQGTSVADPTQSLTIHAAFQMTANANGTLTVNNGTVSCS